MVETAEKSYEFQFMDWYFRNFPRTDPKGQKVSDIMTKTYLMYQFLSTNLRDISHYKNLELKTEPLINEHDILPALQDYATIAFRAFRRSKVYQVPVNIEY
jgi:hypothetical protein